MVPNIKSPEVNICCSLRYLSYMIKKFTTRNFHYKPSDFSLY